MKQRLIITGISIVMLAIVAVLYRWVHWAFLLVAGACILAWIIYLANEYVTYYYFTKGKRLKKYKLTNGEKKLIQELVKSAVNKATWGAALMSIEDAHKIIPGSFKWESDILSLNDYFLGYPRKPF